MNFQGVFGIDLSCSPGVMEASCVEYPSLARGVSVNFPFDAYPGQIAYMKAVIAALDDGKNALLESPTGTGKTLALLCSALAWKGSRFVASSTRTENSKSHAVLESIRSKSSSSASSSKSSPTILYSSRTHSQLQQAIRELRSTPYSPPKVRAGLIAGRSHLCIHHQISKLAHSPSRQNSECLKLLRKGGCIYYNNLKVTSEKLKARVQIPDIEDLVNQVGKKHDSCPYYFALEMAQNADIVFLPYNYLLDPQQRNLLAKSPFGDRGNSQPLVNLANAVVIFDEAHNLESTCMEASSFDLTSGTIRNCIEEVRMVTDALSKDPSGERHDLGNDLVILCDLLLGLESTLDEALEQNWKLDQDVKNNSSTTLQHNKFEDPHTKQVVRTGRFLQILFGKINLNSSNADTMISLIDQTIEKLQDIASEYGRSSGFALEKWRSAVFLAFKEAPEDLSFYKVVLHRNERDMSDENHGPTLSFWCFSPEIALRGLVECRSWILTSGTLSPLDALEQELNSEFPYKLENPHVISDKQVFGAVVTRGPCGISLNSSFENRSNDDYRTEMGNALINFIRIIPDGVLVFFPSYSVLKDCLQIWNNSLGQSRSILERISSIKPYYVEPKTSSSNELNQVLSSFRNSINENRGAVLFAVCRGKIYEGIDFADREGRGVILTGIPYPSMGSLRVRLKREFMDEKLRSVSSTIQNHTLISGKAWYHRAATRTINQAIGRVIRHKNDFGSVILMDERFDWSNIKSGMSKWIQPHIKTYNGFGEVIQSLCKFFKQNSNNYEKSSAIVNSNSAGRSLHIREPISNNEHKETPSNAVAMNSSSILKRILSARSSDKGVLQDSKSSERTGRPSSLAEKLSLKRQRTPIKPSEISQESTSPKSFYIQLKKSCSPEQLHEFRHGIIEDLANIKSKPASELNSDEVDRFRGRVSQFFLNSPELEIFFPAFRRLLPPQLDQLLFSPTNGEKQNSPQ